MIEVIAVVAVLTVVPFAIFIRAQWRAEERERERQSEGTPRHGPPPRSRDSHWGGMGRPGR